MFTKILFYTLIGIATTTIASQQHHAPWFHNIHEEQSEIDDTEIVMVIRCQSVSKPIEDFRENISFHQTPHGMLLALYIEEQQLLGHWPDRIIETNNVLIAWGAHKIVTIKMPYIPIIKMRE